jgi:hypothetical protein
MVELLKGQRELDSALLAMASLVGIDPNAVHQIGLLVICRMRSSKSARLSFTTLSPEEAEALEHVIELKCRAASYLQHSILLRSAARVGLDLPRPFGSRG